MWKWIVGATVVGALLLCVGGGLGGGWWLYGKWRTERALAAGEAEAAARAAEEAAAAASAATERAARLDAARAVAAGGDPKSTVAALDEVIAATPDDAEARLARGRAFALLERYDLAEEDLRVVTRVDPSRREAWETLGWVLGRMGRDAEAVEAYDRLLASAGDDARAFRDRGNARFRAGDVSGAAEDAARACRMGLEEGCQLEERIARATR